LLPSVVLHQAAVLIVVAWERSSTRPLGLTTAPAQCHPVLRLVTASAPSSHPPTVGVTPVPAVGLHPAPVPVTVAGAAAVLLPRRRGRGPDHPGVVAVARLHTAIRTVGVTPALLLLRRRPSWALR
jgi:hypothetical protein